MGCGASAAAAVVDDALGQQPSGTVSHQHEPSSPHKTRLFVGSVIVRDSRNRARSQQTTSRPWI